ADPGSSRRHRAPEDNPAREETCRRGRAQGDRQGRPRSGFRRCRICSERTRTRARGALDRHSGRGLSDMATQILMPALSPTMEEGKLAKWLVKEGQSIKSGDVIAEIETDKATMEVEAVDEGKLEKILVPEGTEGVKVNTPIAVLHGDGEAAAPKAA